MTKYTNINGMEFETIKPKSWSVEKAIEKLAQSKRNTLYDHYERPSSDKIGIYEEWRDWALESPVSCFTVSSANTWQFTIECILYDPETDLDIGLIRITKAHNYLYLI